MKEVVVIGGGVAGMETAGQLSANGYKVTVLEKEKKSGGNLRNWYHLFPDRKPGSEVLEYLEKKAENPNIQVFNETTISSVSKLKSKFSIQTDKGGTIIADALVVATGFDLFSSERKEEYGYGIYENVITSADLEKKFKEGDLRREDGRLPERIGIVHCVGSRDEKSGNLYCSKLCCVTAVKQAIEIREHLPASKVYCFYMDIRMGGAHYEEMYMQSQEKYGVNYIRGKVSEVSETITGNLAIKVEDTLAGRPLRMELDMLILMAGMEISSGSVRIARLLELKQGENRFLSCRDNHYGSSLSHKEGIFLAGTCTAPLNVSETISHARSAALDVMDYLGKSTGQ